MVSKLAMIGQQHEVRTELGCEAGHLIRSEVQNYRIMARTFRTTFRIIIIAIIIAVTPDVVLMNRFIGILTVGAVADPLLCHSYPSLPLRHPAPTTCYSNEDCLTTNSMCAARRCVCKNGYVRKSVGSGFKCILRTSSPTSPPTRAPIYYSTDAPSVAPPPPRCPTLSVPKQNALCQPLGFKSYCLLYCLHHLEYVISYQMLYSKHYLGYQG
jgi:hypothetical protein